MKRRSRTLGISLLAAVGALTVACSREESLTIKHHPKKKPTNAKLNDEAAQRNQQIADSTKRLEELQRQRDAEMAALKTQIAALQNQMNDSADADQVSDLRSQIAALQKALKESTTRSNDEIDILKQKIAMLRATTETLENKIIDKIRASGLSQTNMALMTESLEGHTKIYPLKGKYNTLVIPVEFAPEPGFDGLFKNRERFTSGVVQEELFGNGPTSMHTFYQHASSGLFNVSGFVVEPVRVKRGLTYYGKAITGSNDEHAKELVVDSLKLLKDRVGADSNWWRQFDQWDLNDLDSDGIYSEPDGFLDAVVLVYAGKEQAACQSAFDTKNTRPGSDDVPTDDPRHDAAVECFNRIWPHRSSIFLAKEDPDFPKNGPVIEGEDRGAVGFEINKEVFAFDYNMQSEYSDVSTFIHEFGHSLTLPDVYALQGDNNVGTWDIMAENGRNFAQEQSSYHRMALGWLSPKIVEEGQPFSAYLGNLNYASNTQRENLPDFTGPSIISQIIKGATHDYSVVSTVPQTNEPVYRSLMVRLKPSTKSVQETSFPESVGTRAAYTGRFDGAKRAMNFRVAVPEEGDATLSFDTIYFIETETNFNSRDAEIRVITDYDLGTVTIDGALKEQFRTISGDNNYDTLNESNPECDANRVLALRAKLLAGDISADEKREFKTKLPACLAPMWLKKSYDLSKYRGQKVNVEIAYTTDAGYNEFGIFVDNISIGNTTLYNFEDGDLPSGEWTISKDGTREVRSNQFYLLEYRDPEETFGGNSYNMDQYIQSSRAMGMMLPAQEGLTPRDRFRMMTLHHQPGVLGWLFDSRFTRRENTPDTPEHLGHGYYLPINNELRELTIPGIFDNPNFKDESGFYNFALPAVQKAYAEASAEFKCFAYPKLAEYLDGKAPKCDGYADIDGLKKLSFNGRQLMFGRDSSNNYLPDDQRKQFAVSSPFWLVSRGTYTRSAYQTFRPVEMGEFAPIKVWKADENGNMILDSEMTNQAGKVKPMNRFIDATSLDNAKHLADPRFAANRAIVPSRGFVFDVVSPDEDIVSRYTSPNPDDNNSIIRRPRVKVLIKWVPSLIVEDYR